MGWKGRNWQKDEQWEAAIGIDIMWEIVGGLSQLVLAENILEEAGG